MLISLPEYFGLDTQSKEQFSFLFGLLSILLAIPVVVYSADYYYKSAFNGLKHKNINIDVPITLGIVVLFLRSMYEIVTQTGPGYLDSLSGLVFFLLMGRVFQQKTYKSLSFERDYRSFLPIAVNKWKDSEEFSVSVHQLKVGDEIIIRNQELVPVDSILLSEEANIDNSFVTGESVLIKKKRGDKINAGAKHVGKTIHLKVEKELAQSYLTQLWNDAVFRNENTNNFETLTNKISVYFTLSILIIAFATAFYWYDKNSALAFEAFTAVLIIACPCALALSAPFTFGNILRIFGRNKFYVKNSETVEEMAKITTIVFDKTGTITQTQAGKAVYDGKEMSNEQLSEIKSAVYQSSHPLSKMLYQTLEKYPLVSLDSFKEFPGYGIEAVVNKKTYKIGSAEFCGFEKENIMSGVFIAINDKTMGKFSFDSLFRHGLKSVVDELKNKYIIKIVSGDNDKDKEKLLSIFPENTEMYFNCKPEQKLALVKIWQQQGETVMMIGDGLNDAGALKQSNVGVSVSENINTFSPACDAILDASVFRRLSDFLQFTQTGVQIVIVSFIISFLYNIIGMYFAVQGELSPVFAAILMPVSSITVVSFVTLATNLAAKNKKLL
jgi:Cu+-exporting ATPase